MNTAPPPSSFDGDTEFFEENRWQKLKRRLFEEPLIPLGCALTCWALYEATKSMRSGDKHKTNRMFRRRIYAQGFTILAMVAGSAYWESDRSKRQQYNDLLDEKKKTEKRDAWIRELEVREEEEQEIRAMRKRMMQGRGAEEKGLTERQAQATERKITQDNAPDVGQRGKGADKKLDRGTSVVQSVLERQDLRREGILEAASRLWRSR